MKWTEEKLNEVLSLIKEGKKYNEIGLITNIPWNSIRVKMGKIGEGYLKYNPKQIKICLNCDKEIIKYGTKFCSQSCNAIYNNKLRTKDKSKKKCLNCDELIKTGSIKYCSYNCQQSFQRKKIFEKIEAGDTSLYFRNYKHYLIEKHGEKCMECEWSKTNPISGKIPIELEHIDGDSNNNKLENLKLLCPNCHSLTPTYKALNKGKGRHSRRERYKSGKSY